MSLRRNIHVRAIGLVLKWLGLTVVPVFVIGLFFFAAVQNEYAFDFRQFFQGGVDVLDGRSPYPAADALTSLPDAGRGLDEHEIQDVFRFPYPAFAAVAIAPLAALPFALAAGVLTVVLLAAIALGLGLLGVRDWRCHAVTFSSVLVLGAVTLGTLTPLLFLCLAIAWRYRDRARYAAPALAVAISLKLFLLPVLVWLVATRRLRTAGATLGLAAAALVGGWAAIGWDGFGDYPRLLDALAGAVQHKSFSAVALGLELGLSESAAEALAYALAGGLALGAWLKARRPDGEAAGFALALGACLAFTPIVWLHYFLLLLAPLALARPTFGRLWLLVPAFWLTPFQENEGDLWRFGIAWTVTAIVLAAAVLKDSRLPRQEPALAAPEPAR